VHEIKAVTGHEIARYTEEAEKARLAESASRKVVAMFGKTKET
jgi:hypothetical protein